MRFRSLFRKYFLLSCNHSNFYKRLEIKTFSTSSNYEEDNLCIQKLEKRSIVKVCGVDATNYLHGLITNDTNHLNNNGSSMYAMFLNTRGRVMFDSILYKMDEPDTVFVECDSAVVPSLIKHLLMYKIRRKVIIENYEKEVEVWVAVNRITKLISEKMKNENVFIAKDPRVDELGYRLIVPRKKDFQELLQASNITADRLDYDILRYKLGVAEGPNELPTTNCFPLESNCDYLHGVSFHKGCYIGQELTARTHHTGVIRKRIMPLYFEKELNVTEPDIPVTVQGNPDKVVGKLRGCKGKVGIGLLRIEEALKADNLIVNGVGAKTDKPSWWPTEAPKERQN